MDLVATFLLAALTALATGLGVVPVYWARVGARGLGVLWGLSAGLMASISVLDLLIPAMGRPLPLGIGTLAGVAFVAAASWWMGGHATGHADGHEHYHVGGHEVSTLSLLMVLVFTVHSAPEGVGIGAALRGATTTGLIVVAAIAVHNVPEGTAVAVGLRADGVPAWRAFWAAVATSLPQPLLAPFVFLVAVGPLLPAGMGFAAGAMLILVVTEVAPEGLRRHAWGFVAGALAGVGLGVALNVVLPVPAIV